MSRRQADLFDESASPLKIAFWAQPFHWQALESGLSADEAEALRAEYQMVLAGQRDVLGRPCLCSLVEKFPAAVRGGSNRHGDSWTSPLGLMIDLERAADALPITWRTTREVFEVQGRLDVWRIRRKGHDLMYRRDEDRMPDLGRAHAYAWMAFCMGWRGTRRWPRAETPALAQAA